MQSVKSISFSKNIFLFFLTCTKLSRSSSAAGVAAAAAGQAAAAGHGVVPGRHGSSRPRGSAGGGVKRRSVQLLFYVQTPIIFTIS